MPSPLAIVTGTSSGIGLATAEQLLANGWRIIGLSRTNAPITHQQYRHISCDLSSSREIESSTQEILRTETSIDALINNAGVGYFAPHEEIPSQKITEIVQVNLLAPLLMSSLLLRSLKQSKGWVVNVASFSAHESSSFGAAYAATKAGLRHFTSSLFEETRKSGIRTLCISPDITRTPFYEGLSFEPQEGPEAAIDPKTVAEAIAHAMHQPQGTVISEIVIRPQRILLHKHARGKISS